MKKTVLLCIVLILLVGCSGVEDVEQIDVEVKQEDSAEIVTETECTAGWKCKDNNIKAYQLENCSFINQKECPLGCINDTCKASEVCEAGFKCKGEFYRAYQSESCTWLQKKKCEYGCNESVCNSEPIVEVVEEEEAEVTVQANENIKMGETKTHTIGEVDYNFSLYNINDGQVQILINGRRSEWLDEGSNYSNSGALVIIKGIYFQSYPGGKKEIEYTIS